MTKEERYLQGMERFAEDDLPRAIESFQKALEIDPEYGDALHAIAMCYYHQKDFAGAVKYGEQFRQADPQNTLAYTSLSMFYNARGLIAKAEEMGAMAGAVGRPEGFEPGEPEQD